MRVYYVLRKFSRVMQKVSQRFWDHVRLPFKRDHRRGSQVIRMPCVKCALPTHVVSVTIATTSIYCASMIGLVTSPVFVSDMQANTQSQCERRLRCCILLSADPHSLRWRVYWSPQMIAAPRARVTHCVVSTDALFVPMALAYAFLLAHSWQADTLRLILPGSLQEGFSGTCHAACVAKA